MQRKAGAMIRGPVGKLADTFTLNVPSLDEVE